MAYSGLGAGTIGDPYQITTISQFAEMNSVDYTGKYFLQMNDINAGGLYLGFSNFYCVFNGGGFKITGLNISTGISLKSNSAFTNVSLYGISTSSSSALFKGTNNTVTGVTIENLNLYVETLGISSVLVVSTSIRFGNGCSLKNITAEGYVDAMFYMIGTGLSLENINLNIYRWGGNSAIIMLFGNTIVNSKILIHSFNVANSNIISIGEGGSIKKCTFELGCAFPINIEGNKFSIFALTTTTGVSNSVIEDNLILLNKIEQKEGTFTPILLSPTLNPRTINGLTRNVFYGNIICNGYNGLPLYSSTDTTTQKNYFCQTKITGITPQAGTSQIGLTQAQYQSEAPFESFDFTNIWEIGSEYPILRDSTDYAFLLQTSSVRILSITRLSNDSFKVKTSPSFIEPSNASVLVFNKKDSLTARYPLYEETTVTNQVADLDSTISSEYVDGGETAIGNSIDYYHYYEQTAVDVTIEQGVKFSIQDGTNFGRWVHGSVLVGNSLFGSSRNTSVVTSPTTGCIIKANAENISEFQLLPVFLDEGHTKFASNMDSLVYCDGSLWTYAAEQSGNTVINGIYLIKIDPVLFTYQVFRFLLDFGRPYGTPICTDGTHLFITVKDTTYKVSPLDFVSESQYNTSQVWDFDYLSYFAVQHFTPASNSFSAHSSIVDDTYIWNAYNIATPGVGYHRELHKINKSTLELVDYVEICNTTDDSCQNETHLFLGIELYTNTSSEVGYNRGAVAVRKSDMRVTYLPRLHQNHAVETASYASLIFGDYLIDCKVNGFIFALDISDPDSWSPNENIGKRTLKAYSIYEDSTMISPINEVMLHESGKFVGFVWANPSFVTSFELTGLNYFAAPTVITGDAVLVDDTSVSLSGSISNTGGKTVTNIGIYLGQLPDLSDGVDYPVTPVTTEFEKAFNDLEYGTYYFRTHATNAEGTGYGEIKSFTLEIPYTEPGQPTNLDKTIQAEITINWTAPIDDGGTPITGYKIERKASDGDWAVIVANTGDTETTYTETLPQGVYQYRVSAITAYATSQPSATLDVTAVVGGVGKYRIFLGSTEITTVE